MFTKIGNSMIHKHESITKVINKKHKLSGMLIKLYIPYLKIVKKGLIISLSSKSTTCIPRIALR